MNDGSGDRPGVLSRLLDRFLGRGRDGRGADASYPKREEADPSGCEETEEISCREAVERLYEYLDEELEDEEAEEVRCHVERCKRCYPRFDWERLFLEVLRDRGARPESKPMLREKVEGLLSGVEEAE